MNDAMRDEFADAWIELDDDPEVRVIVHTGEGRAFQTGVDVLPRSRPTASAWSATASRWRTWTSTSPRGTRTCEKPVITAVNGICAGGALPLGRRRRHRDRRDRRAVLRPARVGRPGRVASRPSGCMRKMPVEAVMRMAFVGRYERMTRPAGLRAGHDQPDRRPAREPARGGAGARREDRQELAGRDGRHASRRCGARSSSGSPTPARRAPRDLVVDVGPPRPGGGARRLRREARGAVGRPLTPHASNTQSSNDGH